MPNRRTPASTTEPHDLATLRERFQHAAFEEKSAVPRPANVSVREAAQWMRVSHPTAAKVIGEARPTSKLTLPSALRDVEPLNHASPSRIVAVVQDGEPTVRAMVASGIGCGLALLGWDVVIREAVAPGPIARALGARADGSVAKWPRLQCVGPGDVPTPGTVRICTVWDLPLTVAAPYESVLDRAHLVLIPYAERLDGFSAVASSLAIAEKTGMRARVLMVRYQARREKPVVEADHLPDIADLEEARASGVSAAVLFDQRKVSSRLLLAIRHSIAGLSLALHDTLA